MYIIFVVVLMRQRLVILFGFFWESSMAASLPNNDDKKWLIFEDDMPIDDFLKRNPPSQIEGSQYSYLCVRHFDFSKIKSPDKASLRKECDSHIETLARLPQITFYSWPRNTTTKQENGWSTQKGRERTDTILVAASQRRKYVSSRTALSFS